jgi:hypothetical protein
MRKFLMLGAVLALVAVVVPATAGSAATRGGAKAGRAPAIAPTGTPTITADPSTGLLDGQSISVTGSGLTKGHDFLAECVTGATDPLDSCDPESAAGVKVGRSGAFSLSFTAVRMVEDGEIGSTVDCATADACILALFDEDFTLLADTPISFADVTIVPPTVAAVPSTGLLNGEKIAVSGANWTPGAQIALAECPTAPDSGCGFTTSGRHPLIVGSDGTFTAPFKAIRFIEGGESPVDCAQASACVLDAFNVDDPDQTASTPITFADVTVVPPVLAASPSSDLSDGQNITVTGSGFARHDYVILTECTAGSAATTECTALGGVGAVVQVKTDSRGRFTATFNVARMLTFPSGTVDCTVAPGCVIGAIDEESELQTPEAVTALSFNPAVPPLPPLNLELTIDPTGTLVAGAKGQTDAQITGTISCDRTTPIPVAFDLEVSQHGTRLTRKTVVEGETPCQRGGAKFSETVPATKKHPAVPGTADVLMDLSAVSGSDVQDIEVSASVTLKAPKS